MLGVAPSFRLCLPKPESHSVDLPCADHERDPEPADASAVLLLARSKTEGNRAVADSSSAQN